MCFERKLSKKTRYRIHDNVFPYIQLVISILLPDPNHRRKNNRL
jgi:hypothetical protein